MEKLNIIKDFICDEIRYCKKSYRHLDELESAYTKIVLECEVLTNVRKCVQLTNDDFIITINYNNIHLRICISRKDFKVSYLKCKIPHKSCGECILTLSKKDDLYSLTAYYTSTKTEKEIIKDCRQITKPLNKFFQFVDIYS